MKRLLKNETFISAIFVIIGIIVSLGILTLFAMWFKWLLTYFAS